jgi:hypothetical protein
MARLILWIFLLSLGLSSLAEAQQAPGAVSYAPLRYRAKESPGFAADLQASLLSSFVFRGRDMYDGLHLQPSFQPRYSFGDYGSLSGLLLFVAPLEGSRESEKYFVVDQGFAYDYTYSRFTFSLGQYWYGYPSRSSSVNSTSEVWGAISLDTVLSPSFRAYWDYDAFDAMYYEIFLSHTFKRSGEGAFNLTVFSNLGFASHAQGLYQHGGLVQITSGVSTDLKLGSIVLRPSIAYTGAEDANAVNRIWGGVAAVYSF